MLYQCPHYCTLPSPFPSKLTIQSSKKKKDALRAYWDAMVEEQHTVNERMAHGEAIVASMRQKLRWGSTHDEEVGQASG